MTLSYQQSGLTLAPGSTGPLTADLQRDLRTLGYLRRGVDGSFGQGTAAAIRSLRYDLLHANTSGADDPSPFAIAECNIGPGGASLVSEVNEILDQPLATCIAALLADSRAGWLPNSTQPQIDNANALKAIQSRSSWPAPVPFMVAMFIQESNGQHFYEPARGDADDFIVLGLDRNNKEQPDQITSRGYGIGQFTIAHHPPLPTEVSSFMLDPVQNVEQAFQELHADFYGKILGQYPAYDRLVEHPSIALRPCRYQPGDPRYMTDCKRCANEVPTLTIHQGTPVFQGASYGYQPDQYYPSAEYTGIPDRAAFLCDWPYAARRYNGDGNNSYHYQARILRNVAAGAGMQGV